MKVARAVSIVIVMLLSAFSAAVLAFGIPRAEAITEDGMTLSGPQGVAESNNFQETSSGQGATTGDFILKAEEVNPVISALEEHNIQVPALHSHMLTEQPRGDSSSCIFGPPQASPRGYETYAKEHT